MAPVCSVLRDENKLSIAALSHTLPARLIEQTTAFSHQALELFAGVFAAAIGVMQQRIGLAAPSDRHHQRIGNELCGYRRTHGQRTTRRENGRCLAHPVPPNPGASQ
jgi:hypothetical protein